MKKLYKAAAINAAIRHLSKDYNIRKSNKRKAYTEGEINFKNNNFISGSVISFFVTGTVYDQIVLKAKKYAKSTIIKNLFEQFKDALILWIIAIQIILIVIEN